MKRRLGVICVILLVSACGKKGPPLPPLVRLPAAPADFAAWRRGGAVAIELVVPGANTDGSTPADLSRVDVYALTGTAVAPPDDIVRRGQKIASVVVNPVPDDEEEGDLPPEERESKKLPNGVDQGATAHLTDSLAAAPGSEPAAVRSYVAVGLNARGRRGAVTGRSVVPLGDAPPAPGAPTITYDEKTITLVWAPAAQGADSEPSYHVYAPADVERRLTNRAIPEPRYQEPGGEWGVERCYAVRTAGSIDGVTVESEASGWSCITPVDTFPPAPPAGLQAVASQDAVDLIWNPSTEDDLAGYVVLRAVGAAQLAPVSVELLREATFRDALPSGTRVTYAVQAVDSAGNRSDPSPHIEETAR